MQDSQPNSLESRLSGQQEGPALLAIVREVEQCDDLDEMDPAARESITKRARGISERLASSYCNSSENKNLIVLQWNLAEDIARQVNGLCAVVHPDDDDLKPHADSIKSRIAAGLPPTSLETARVVVAANQTSKADVRTQPDSAIDGGTGSIVPVALVIAFVLVAIGRVVSPVAATIGVFIFVGALIYVLGGAWQRRTESSARPTVRARLIVPTAAECELFADYDQRMGTPAKDICTLLEDVYLDGSKLSNPAEMRKEIQAAIETGQKWILHHWDMDLPEVASRIHFNRVMAVEGWVDLLEHLLRGGPQGKSVKESLNGIYVCANGADDSASELRLSCRVLSMPSGVSSQPTSGT